jgi:hypothetical protein
VLDREELKKQLGRAVKGFWAIRKLQAKKQRRRGQSDQGARTAVTGGKQMDGFVRLVTKLLVEAGLEKKYIHHNAKLELPGYYRAEKQWDLIAVCAGELLAAIEVKSQVGPSFGNNFNNRCEEAIGSAVDLRTAYREGALNKAIKPWLGYLFLLEDCDATRTPVRVREPHFKVMPEFEDASYMKRYEVLCRKLIRENQYDAAALLCSAKDKGAKGIYTEPAEDLTFEYFARSLAAHISSFVDMESP